MSDSDSLLLVCGLYVAAGLYWFGLSMTVGHGPMRRLVNKAPTNDAEIVTGILCVLLWPVAAVLLVCKVPSLLFHIVEIFGILIKGTRDLLPKKTNLPKAKVVK
jgi:hypothetical protein